MIIQDHKGVGPRATIKDVANLAGVGVGTVSRVLNQTPQVSPKNIAAVTRAIEELGYRRNDSARTLRTGATKSIGLLVQDVADPFFSQLNRAVEDIVVRLGSVLLTGFSIRDPERTQNLILNFCSRGVDGLILTLSEGIDEQYLIQENQRGVAMVCVDRPPRKLNVDTVLTDNRGGAAMGVQHLISHGHRRIACITDEPSMYTVQERLRGYGDALTRAGIEVDPTLIFCGSPSISIVAEALEAMLQSSEPPTAIFTGNGPSNMAVLNVLRTRSMHLAIVAFDDFAQADIIEPGITVVAQDPHLVGVTAMALLQERIKGSKVPARTVVQATQLIQRGSGEVFITA